MALAFIPGLIRAGVDGKHLSVMRAGILSNSLPAAISIRDEVEKVFGVKAYVLLCGSFGESAAKSLLKHVYRFLFERHRLRSLKLVLTGPFIFLQNKLDGEQTVSRIKGLELDVGLHRTGHIYRQATIDAFRSGILNSHIGLLPRYRGRSVMEWALIEDAPVGITVFFLDTGIDTGQRIVLSEEVDIAHCSSVDAAKQYLFDLDAVFFRKAIEKLNRNQFEFQLNDNTGRRYYPVSRLFKQLAETKLRGR